MSSVAVDSQFDITSLRAQAVCEVTDILKSRFQLAMPNVYAHVMKSLGSSCIRQVIANADRSDTREHTGMRLSQGIRQMPAL